jgi:cellulose synthase/poly-beta-1,6-N-acetylglucosamine synthase-like glycosyltransferase
MTQPGVSVVVPVHNGERWLDEALTAILAQREGRLFEVIAVDDGSTDRSAGILAAREATGDVRVLHSAKRGAAAAMNQGIRQTSHPIICLIDQDVVLKPGWMAAILEPLHELGVAAVQGYFVTDPRAPVVARVAGMDLEQRYAAIGEGPTSHVCTGNSAYRAEALHEAGLFDESFGYGYDNDLSYRLMRAGYTLRFCPGARSVHRWRETLRGYLIQQYGQGYGRLDIVWKHPGWVAGDAVSPSMMMAHAPLMAAALASCAASLLLGAAGLPWRQAAALAGIIVAGLALERLAAGVRAAVRHRDAAGLLFVPLHLLRDAAWALAIAAWAARRLAGRGRHPSQSMGTRRRRQKR